MPEKTSVVTAAKASANTIARICVDRIIPSEYQPARAVMESAAQSRRRGSEIDPSKVIPARLAIPSVKCWPNGSTLDCRFLDGSKTQRKKVEQYAHAWEKYANITFKFVATGDAEIRISFIADGSSWSAVGTDSLVASYFPKYQPTMNYGWLRDDTSEQEYSRVVLHEFGHALGCIHEHQSPKFKRKWNKAEVYRVFEGPPSYWTKDQIDHNVLLRYSKNGMLVTEDYDDESIMLYQFDGILFKDGDGTKENTKLSKKDKEFITTIYPKT